jgi:hypothetical protein
MLESVLFPVGTVLLGLTLVAIGVVSLFLFAAAVCGGVAGCISLLREFRRHPAARRV